MAVTYDQITATELYDRIISDNLYVADVFQHCIVNSGSASVKLSTDKYCIILCGPAGSGKSVVKKQILSDYGIATYVNIDPDNIRTFLTGERNLQDDTEYSNM